MAITIYNSEDFTLLILDLNEKSCDKFGFQFISVERK